MVSIIRASIKLVKMKGVQIKTNFYDFSINFRFI